MVDRGPLAHLRVVEVTDLRGALCGRILADLGADVVKVLRPTLAPSEYESTAYRYRNANKRAAVIVLHSTDDRARFDALLDGADVLIENLGPAQQRAHELVPEQVARRHPRLVQVSLTDFGLNGPRREWHLEPLTALAASGTMWATGFPDRPPCWMPGYLAHDCASVYGAVGALAAVLDRGRSGRGQRVEVSTQEAALAGTTPWSVAIADYLHINPRLNAKGTRSADGAYWVLPAKDGWVRTVIGTPRQWQGFVELCDSPEAFTDAEWSNPGFRLANADVVRMIAETCLTDRTREELFASARALGTTMGVLHTPSEFVAHEQTKSRGFFAATGFGGLGDAPFASAPYKLSATPASLRRAAPTPRDAASSEDGFAPQPSRSARGGAEQEEEEDAGLLLAGVRVVEFGMAAVVPETCGVLSELGADVIKVESTTHPDVLRLASTGLNKNFTFNAESRGRESVAIDLSTEGGRELALRLCATADIVAENYRGGVLDRLGLGYDTVRAVNPAVVYVSSQGYGRGGPYGEMPAFGPLNAGFAGLHHLWSDPDAPYPCGTSLNHPDHIAGKLLAVAVLAAWVHRQRTGEGQHVDMAQTEAAAYLIGEVYLDAALTGVDPGARGNRSDVAVPHGVYPSAGDDAWIAIAVPDDATWRALEAAVGWPTDDSLATLPARLAAREAIDERLTAWTSLRPAAQAAEVLQAAHVSAMPVMGPFDHHGDPHLTERGAIVTLQHPEVGIEHHVANPIRMELAQRVAGSAPCLGADTDKVLRRWLDLSDGEIESLAAAGVCR
ncbi:MAG TPA: CoA transferase [Acidimicrobiales bacterium]|nr:CoA transferase [Acidimicrobiales bacterium]